MDKSLIEFVEFEREYLGFGYGSGEKHIIRVMRTFLLLFPQEGVYDYKKMEKMLNPTTTWFLINIFCKADLIEYGCSPRHGWLTDEGKVIKSVFEKHSDDKLYDSIMNYDDDFDTLPIELIEE